MRRNTKNPGPGAYDPVHFDKEPSFTMRSRTKILSESQNTPGVGSYNIEHHVPGSRAGGITMHKRSGVKRSDLQRSPGPGDYDLSKSTYYFGHGSSGFSLAKRTRLDYKDTYQAGPGSYNIASDCRKDQPAYSLKSRVKLPEMATSTPGPCGYNPYNSTYRSASCS